MIILYTYKPIPIKTKQNSFYFPYPELKENIGCQIKPVEYINHARALALLLLPGLLGPPAFIFLCEKLRRSPLDTASPLLACLFFPPNPNFSFFFWRLAPGLLASVRARLRLPAWSALSMATSKRSLASSVGPEESVLRSVITLACTHQHP